MRSKCLIPREGRITMEFGFTGGNIIVLGVVAIAFVIYYQLSKNNQTLRKVKRYGDMIQSDLQVFVEEKPTRSKTSLSSWKCIRKPERRS
jgi:hypothetical protein